MRFPRGWVRASRGMLAGLALVSTAAMSAEADVEFLVDSAAVVAIKKSLAVRFVQLKDSFQDGVIGFTHDGLIALREAGGLTRNRRAGIELLISEDNKERSALYREIARANGHPDWESRFQSVFAGRWISRAPVGWYLRDASGNWVKKLPPAPE